MSFLALFPFLLTLMLPEQLSGKQGSGVGRGAGDAVEGGLSLGRMPDDGAIVVRPACKDTSVGQEQKQRKVKGHSAKVVQAEMLPQHEQDLWMHARPGLLFACTLLVCAYFRR